MRGTRGAERKRTFDYVPGETRRNGGETLERNTENVFREGRWEGRDVAAPSRCCQVLLPLQRRYITDKPFHATFTILFYFERYIFLDFIAAFREREREREREGGREREKENTMLDWSRILFVFNYMGTEIHAIIS